MKQEVDVVVNDRIAATVVINKRLDEISYSIVDGILHGMRWSLERSILATQCKITAILLSDLLETGVSIHARS